MKKGTIILLNGVSSSGKSTLAKELVAALDGYFHLSVDDFDRLIEKMETRGTDHLIPVPTETFFHRTVAMFSDQGINLIVDHVLHDGETTRDCLDVLLDHPVCFVGVHCPVEELEKRERMRGDRTIGQARAQLAYVHRQESYDVEVDTHGGGAAESIIRRICEGEFTGLRETSETLSPRS
ncbi:chloramphenicol phosphotransferase CPT family protein [Exiguobacterium flavidum]|uniref:chloramphenicol phosphotransferase CPT family protein n=1 Tax=Exiguobacterium flavidum TaxID=2184695 RepID=UPI000DF7A2B1|nr:AAA family ATPase [Exiguobacterium flavidum]